MSTTKLLRVLAVGAIFTILSEHVAADFTSYSSGYTFRYEESTNVLLTTHYNDCYFSHINPGVNDQLQGYFLLQLQENIKAIIRDPDSPLKFNSTLDEVREQYHSVLGSSLCFNHTIHTIWVDVLACDFEHYPDCSWKINFQRSFQWQFHSSVTPSVLTGPDNDHTLKNENGHYIYAEANFGRPNAIAELHTPVLELSDSFCLKFWYHMYGTGMGTLSLNIEESGHVASLLNITGNQGNVWKLAQVTIPASLSGSPRPVELILLATRGLNHFGDIAVDDISSVPGMCDAQKLDCSFEAGEGLCNWRQDKTGDTLDWTLHSGPTDTQGTGPDAALRTVNGDNHVYLYLEGSLGTVGDMAELQSSPITFTEPMCLSFWYLMKGLGVQSLSVFLYNTNTNSETIEWELRGPQGTGTWTEARVDLRPSYPGSFYTVIFRATRGTSDLSDIAIDLIQGTTGPCTQRAHQNEAAIG